MGGILVYQKEEQAVPEIPELFRWMVFISEPEQVLHVLEKGHYQMIMIHLDKEGESGLEAASLVRGLPGYYLTPILFLAPDHRYERKAFYEYHCYDYLVKPIRRDEIIKIVYPFLVQLCAEKRERWFRVKSHGVIRFILLYDILYIESMNRSVIVHTECERIEIPYLSLRQCQEEYASVFIQCHRSVLVNRNYVLQIDYREKKIQLPGCCVDIGRQYESVLHREFDR